MLARRSERKIRPRMDGINYIGDLRADIGISEHSRLTVQTLLEARLSVAYTEIPYPVTSRTQPLPDGLGSGAPFDLSLIDKNFSHWADALLDIPRDALLNRYRIALWAWELETFPAQYHRWFATMDEIWVGSRFTQDALARVSTVPVIRMPFALAPTTSPTASRAAFGLPDDLFIFLFTFSATSTAARKNPFGVIEAFRRAFGTHPSQILLVIKAHHLDHADAEALRTALRAEMSQINGRLLETHLNRTQTYNLTALCDAYISLHRAEGFGLTIAEAMALGKPVIATAYSGCTDYMTLKNSYPVTFSVRQITDEDHRFQPALSSLYPPGLLWADPDIDHAAYWMQYVYQNSEAARMVGMQAKSDMQRDYSPEVIGNRILERLRVISGASPGNSNHARDD